MVSVIHGDGVETLNEDGCEPKHTMSLKISPSRKGLLSDEKSPKDFPDNVTTSLSSRLKMLKISPKGHFALPPIRFQPMAKVDKKTSFNDPPTVGSLRKRFKNRLFKDIDWSSLTRMCKEWVRKPLNMALVLWVACVVVSGAILFLVMTGMLNSALHSKAQRDL